MFWTMNDIPTAVISTARRGAERSRRYATRSIVVLTSAPKAIAIRKVAKRPAMMTNTADCSSRWKMLTIQVLAKRPLSAKTSPWAKLISCRIP
jgi:hypothetical protein